jgi:histone deacetylase 1/2
MHLQPSEVENQNSREGLEEIKIQILQQLSQIQGAPSVQMQEVPPDWATGSAAAAAAAAEEGNPDQRPGNLNRLGGSKPEHEAEYYEGDKDQDK